MRVMAWMVLGLAACGSPTQSIPIDVRLLPPTTVTLRVGQEQSLGGIRIGFSEVLTDSRCPVDVTCVWAGNAQLSLSVGPQAGDGPTYQLRLNTDLDPRSGTAIGIRVTLLSLEPAPTAGGGIRASEYRAVLDVRGAGLASP